MKAKTNLSKKKGSKNRSLPINAVKPRLYQVICQWQPPKMLWPTLGTHWRKILVIVEDAGDYHTAAWEAGKFIIRERMGQAVALVVIVDTEVHVLMNDVINCWEHHEGMMIVDRSIAFCADLE
jgi:hypothetical protein